jgi:predicted HNH restriction endonuclease
MPISWETQSIDTIMRNLRTDVAGYTFLLANFCGRVAGMSTWTFEVLSGSRSPSEVLSVSSEALLNPILLNYWKAWEAQTQADQTTDDSTQTSAVSSITEASAATRYTKSNNGSTKDGWSVEGICHFEDLMMRVEDDRNSEDGKKFEKNFQQLMKECNQARKRSRPRATEQITSIQNDLSDASTSGDKGN